MKFKKSTDGEDIQKKDYSKKVIFPLSDFEEKGHLLQVVTIPPHTKQRFHVHDIQTEVSYLLEGKAHFWVEDKEFVMQPGDALIHPHGEKHSVWNQSDKPCKLLVFKINLAEDSDDTRWLEE